MADSTFTDVTRRDALRLLAGAAAATGLAGGTGGTGEYVVEQGGDCAPVTPLSGDVPVEEFYDYQLVAGEFDGENGASDDGGPYFGSPGTRSLQRADTSQLFLYRGPEGLSLVVLHGSLAESDRGGGSATFTISGLPEDGSWVVKDDYYLDPETGEPAPSNYDRWRTNGSPHAIAWTWGSDLTDGGAFRDLDGALGGDGVTVDPAFGDAAERLSYNYEGRVTDWQVLSGSVDSPDRLSLATDEPVTIRRGSCESEDGGSENVVCHEPPGNPDNSRTLEVGSEAAVQSHLGHGDERGPCDG